MNEITGLKLHDLVCFDESGFHTGMSRVYARAPRNQRAFARVPRNTGKNLTLLCAMSSQGSQAELVIEGAVNAAVFESYVDQVLCPTLQSGQTVLMDNLSSHQGAKVRALIEARGCQLVYFPPYSPDFNPIEMLFSKLKALLRKAAARTTETVIEALGFALRAVTPNDILGWFHHALPLSSL
ncbi:IS630 family transposase [Deinococcus peraridilitoris]|uniref:IS630 family transposase n=1 Tax=Deinococcus peraridilitoris TaxID=432329 RepID=UPI00059BD294|nr:IS630 family transposase [Deinococcus peraridilitoris]